MEGWNKSDYEREIYELREKNKRLEGGCIPMPKELIGRFHNACTDPCDMLYGPCACGAGHSVKEWFRKHYEAGYKDAKKKIEQALRA